MRKKKGAETGKRVVVRQYGLLPPLNWDNDCQEHLFLMNRFWNRLVEIERDNRLRYRALVGAQGGVAEINAEIDEIKARIVEHDEARKEARKQHRAKRGPHTAEHDAAIKGLKARIKELSPRAKALRQEARAVIKPAADALEQERKEAVKAAYAASGLWWCNYNAVIDSYNVARSRAMKEGTELRFHRFDGTGRFTCQIQGGMSTHQLLNSGQAIASVRLISPEDFAGAISDAGVLHQTPGSRLNRRQYGILSITVYTGRDEEGNRTRRMLDFPIILHRPLPEGATLKTLSVKRAKCGPGSYRWSVTFTFTDEAMGQRHASPDICGLNLGWKQVKNGLRVATLHDGSEVKHYVLPAAILRSLDHVDELKSRIDQATNENFKWLFDNISAPPQALDEPFARMKRAKKPHAALFAKLVWQWKKAAETFRPALLDEAEKRRKQVKRLENEHNFLRAKTLRRRLDLYRNIAMEIAERYSRITLDKMDLRGMAKLEVAGGAPTDLVAPVRSNRSKAALSELREWLTKQAAKRGGEVVQLPIKSSSICSDCGGMVENEKRDIFRACATCGKVWDCDENAAANLLKAGRSWEPPVADDAADQERAVG